MSDRFVRYELRTTDVAAARTFYQEIFGTHFWRSHLLATALPAQAVAHGAPAHWLGHVGARNAAAIVNRMLATGARQLGPMRNAEGGATLVVIRDPFGAVVAVSGAGNPPEDGGVSWHLLTAEDDARAFALYTELLGWTPAGEADLGPDAGHHRMFAWDQSGRPAGSVADTARLAHIHPQWLFFFSVDDITESSERVRVLGGNALPAIPTPTGDLVAACEDPQGAAFGLLQPRP